jgi:Domain of unknown function (DUF222)
MSSPTAPPVSHPVLAALGSLGAALDLLGESEVWTLGGADLLDARVGAERLSARLASARLRLTGEIDSRGAAVAAGATSTTAWLVNRLRQGPGEAARETRLAAALTSGGLPAVAAALAAGDLSLAAASVVADTDRDLAGYATAAQRAEAQQSLVAHAATLTVPQLVALARRVAVLLDPDQGDRQGADEKTQRSRRELHLKLALERLQQVGAIRATSDHEGPSTSTSRRSPRARCSW